MKNIKCNEKENYNKELMSLLIGRKGGKNTIRIIDSLLTQPYNMHQLSKKLNLNYKTIQYHINIIHEHDLLITENIEYGTVYCLSEKLMDNLNTYKEIKEIVMKNEGDRNEK